MHVASKCTLAQINISLSAILLHDILLVQRCQYRANNIMALTTMPILYFGTPQKWDGAWGGRLGGGG